MKIQKQRTPTTECKERATKLFEKLICLASSRKNHIEVIALALDAEYWKGSSDSAANLFKDRYTFPVEESGADPQT